MSTMAELFGDLVDTMFNFGSHPAPLGVLFNLFNLSQKQRNATKKGF